MKTYNSLTISTQIPRVMETTGIYAETPQEVFDFCNDMQDLSQEIFVVLCLNTRKRIISRQMVSMGILDSSLVHPREVFRVAIVQNSRGIVLVHNHPSGDPSPSQTDLKLTRQLIQCGEILGINVLDHIIIGRKDERIRSDFVSLRELGMVTFKG